MAVGARTVTCEMDASERLDWGWDWADWLADGETITALDVTVTGATLDGSGHAGTVTTAWIIAPAPPRATVTYRVTTSASRVAEAVIDLVIST